jgi:ubiquinone/menaquinone biosynthesis C-methylase UbiE
MKYDAGAAAYDRLTGRWSRLYAPALLEAASSSSRSSVLDLATGTGDAALLAGQSVESAGHVIGVDISVPMLQVAASKSLTSNVSFMAADAMMLPFGNGTFDIVICQFGLMFFPDRVAALAETRRILRPGGRVALTVWGSPDQAPFAGIMARALGEVLPSARDELLLPFALANPAEVLRLLESAGFHGNHVKRETRDAHFESAADFLEPYEQSGGRLGQAYLQLTPDARTVVREDVLTQLAGFTQSDRITMEILAYLASGVA